MVSPVLREQRPPEMRGWISAHSQKRTWSEIKACGRDRAQAVSGQPASQRGSLGVRTLPILSAAHLTIIHEMSGQDESGCEQPQYSQNIRQSIRSRRGCVPLWDTLSESPADLCTFATALGTQIV